MCPPRAPAPRPPRPPAPRAAPGGSRGGGWRRTKKISERFRFHTQSNEKKSGALRVRPSAGADFPQAAQYFRGEGARRAARAYQRSLELPGAGGATGVSSGAACAWRFGRVGERARFSRAASVAEASSRQISKVNWACVLRCVAGMTLGSSEARGTATGGCHARGAGWARTCSLRESHVELAPPILLSSSQLAPRWALRERGQRTRGGACGRVMRSVRVRVFGRGRGGARWSVGGACEVSC